MPNILYVGTGLVIEEGVGRRNKMSKRQIKRSITVTDLAISFALFAISSLAVAVIGIFLPLF